jgi:nucleotide-binding universal stress UspA family protein
MKTILVGYDDTEPSKHALEQAADIAKAFGANLHVTSVAPVLVGGPRSGGPYDPADPPSAHREQLNHATALLQGRGITPTVEEAHGDPAEMIISVADQVDADLIVLGSHERSLIEHALGMSVSGSVARKAHRNVLIVH